MKCFRCGKRDALVDGLCRECYMETHEILEVPDYIDLRVCPHCGALSRDGNRWVDFEDFDKGIIETAIRFLEISKSAHIMEIDAELVHSDPSSFLIKGNVLVKIGELKEELEFESKIRLKRNTCPKCSRIHGGYYEAIIQVRGPERPLTMEEKADAEEFIVSRIEEMSRTSRDVFITDEEEVHGGLDFYISKSRAAKNVARALADHFSGKITESKKLSGRKEGEDIYRFTYLVRLPEFRKGDFVEYMGDYYQIISNTGDTWRLYSLNHRTERKVRGKDGRKFRTVARKEDVEEAVVVSYREGEVQVLHPETYRTVTLKKDKNPGTTMRIIRIDGEIYALRDDE